MSHAISPVQFARLFLAAAVLAGQSTVGAATLQKYSTNSSCGAGADRQNDGQLGPTDVTCSNTLHVPGVTYTTSGSGSALVTLGANSLTQSPFTLEVTGSAHARAEPDPLSTGSYFTTASGGGSAILAFQVVPSGPLPGGVSLGSVGMTFSSIGTASVQGGGVAGAYANLVNGYNGLIIASLYDTSQVSGVVQQSTFQIGIGVAFLLDQHASCVAFADTSGAVGTSPDSSCSATIDPVLTFDQAGFDAAMGDQTFPLADYFRVEFSPNLTLVPAPATLPLLATALAMFCAALVRRPRFARRNHGQV